MISGIFETTKKRGYLNPYQYRKNKNDFQQYISEAKRIIKIAKKNSNQFNNHPIFDYIKIFTTKIQMFLIQNLICKKSDNDELDNKIIQGISIRNSLIRDSLTYINPYRSICRDNFIICEDDFEKCEEIKEKDKFSITLNRNPVLSPLWHLYRFENTITSIGYNTKNSFKFDRINHFSELILPMGVTLAYNGLHSTSTGILKGEGEIYPESIVNIEKIYDVIFFDGNNCRLKSDNTVFYSPFIKELGIIFEIGRLILEEDIIYHPN